MSRCIECNKDIGESFSILCWDCVKDKKWESCEPKEMKLRRYCGTCDILGMLDSSNVYQQCSECIDWKLPLQEKPSWK